MWLGIPHQKPSLIKLEIVVSLVGFGSIFYKLSQTDVYQVMAILGSVIALI